MRRIPVLAALLVGAALALSGCAAAGADPDGTATTPPQSTSLAATGLVGLWRVSGAKDETDRSWLRISGNDVMLWSRCGVYGGNWKGADGLLVFGIAEVQNAHCPINGHTIRGPAWIRAVAGYRAAPGGWTLEDATGHAVATLAVNGRPPTSKDYADEFTRPPTLTAHDRAKLAEPAPLPSAATPVPDLTGKWVPVKRVRAVSWVRFSADGSLDGTDGCNETGGTWLSGPNGLLLTGGGASTLVGCEGSPLVYWAFQASRVGMIGDRLTFFDHDGRQLGQAVRS